MTDWTAGYVADMPYSAGFYREMTPLHIALASTAVGRDNANCLKPQRVLELGFGMGFGFILTAASNPSVHFEGCDFNPEHAVHARNLAASAGLTNVTVSDASFQDIARAAHDGQADLDLILLHGILTWVSADARAAIVEIARKRLKPGGLLYVSYNCHPGWAPAMPMQRLIRETAKRAPGNSVTQMNAALALLKELGANGARYFAANPQLMPRIEKMEGSSRNYLAHEYLNADWNIFHFADVADLLNNAKLNFVASASIAENIDSVSTPETMRAQVGAATDPVWRETLRDYASNKQFRRDIFTKGALLLTPQETLAQQDAFRFMLGVPRDKVVFKIPSMLGELDANPEIYGALADALSLKVMSLPEIASLPAFAKVGRAGALQSVALMVHAGQVLPIAPGPTPDLKPGQRFNRVVAERLMRGRVYNFLAAPVAGSGITATNTEIIMLGALHRGAREQAGALTDAVMSSMKQIGIAPIRDGKAVSDDAEQRKIMTADVENFLNSTLPVWKKLGVV